MTLKNSLSARYFALALLFTITNCTSLSAAPTKAVTSKSPVTAKAANAQGSNGHTASQLWALACPALLTERNGERHDVLWCYNPPQQVEEEKRLLSRWWDVNSRSDLFRALDWIERGGHRELFNDYSESISRGDVQGIKDKWHDDDNEIKRRTALIEKYGLALGSKSLMGWDYCRYIALCRWGVLCSYLSQEEAWAKIMPAARQLQTTFTSWEDLGQNYLIGREFWSAEQTADTGELFARNYRKLLTDRDSPWIRIPWKTDLSVGAYATVK